MLFLKKDEEIEMIKAINGLLEQKVPYVRRNYTKATKIRTIFREEPIKLAQYIRGKRAWLDTYSYMCTSAMSCPKK